MNMTNTAATTATRRVTLSARKTANMGARYLAEFVGMRVVHTTSEGETIEGVLAFGTSKFQPSHSHGLIVEFADGRWARAGDDLAIIA